MSLTRLVDRALVLTVVTFTLLTPPVIAIFDWPSRFFGVPALHMYVFTVWIVAIVLCARLAPRLLATPDAAPPPVVPPDRRSGA